MSTSQSNRSLTELASNSAAPSALRSRRRVADVRAVRSRERHDVSQSAGCEFSVFNGVLEPGLGCMGLLRNAKHVVEVRDRVDRLFAIELHFQVVLHPNKADRRFRRELMSRE